MAVIGGSAPIVTDGLVYALDFSNAKTYVSGSNTAKSLIFDTTTTALTGLFNFDNRNLIFAGNTTTYIQRSGSIVDTSPTSNYTVCMLVNVIRPGSFLIQNTSTVNFAAQISTSSFDVGYYNATTATYYTRRFPVTLNTGSLYVACRYSNGTIDLFLNGLPVSSSQANVIMTSQITGSDRSDALLYSRTGSLFVGALPSSVTAFSGSLSQFSVYNRALTSTEIYSNYVPHITSQYQLPVTSLTKPYTLDENTLLYVSASGISSSAVITAVDSFITGLKTNGLWNKLSAIYPYIGSTTASQAINLKEPGLNRLVYTGSWSASLSGSTPITTQSYLQLSGFDYPAIATSSAHITYLSYDLPQVTASLVAVDKPLRALGGEIFYSGSRTYHVYKPTGTSSFQVVDPSLTAVEVLVVAGGGSGYGGGYSAGGGGAGGLVYSSSFSIAGTSSVSLVVGRGADSANGHNSSFGSIVAFGGGNGSTNGGSGGGGGSTFDSTGSAGSGSAGQGNNGGFGLRVYDHGSGGGGGAGAPGENAGTTGSRAGKGGNGLYFSQYAGIGLGFPAGWFAGGGGGSNAFANRTGEAGGFGGGGSGSKWVEGGIAGEPGKPNTGGGAGGRGYIDGNIYNGGSGIVIVSYSSSLATFTSSFGISLSGSNVIGNLHSTSTSGISFSNASIGLVTVSRTGSTSLSIHKDVTSSVITAPISASIIGSVYGNASNFAGTLSRVSPYTLSYLSYGAGMSPSEVNTYHALTSKLQYDLGRANLIEGYPAAAAYSVRRLSRTAQYSMNVRRGFDDVTFNVGFDTLGNLDTGSLLTNMTASGVATTLPGAYSGLAAAYSLRRVSSSYTGSAVKVRGDIENQFRDIGFDAFGNLNTSSLLNFTATGSNTLAGSYSGLSAAFSLRKVVPGYAGFAIQIQSASAIQDIGFNSLGDLDTGSIASFAGSGDAFVRTWYDQSGNGNNAIQTDTADQPKIYSGSQGSVVLENGKPAIHFNQKSINTANFLNSDLANSGISAFSVYSLVNYSGGLYDVDFIYTTGGSGLSRLLEFAVIGPTATPQNYISIVQFGLPTVTSSFTYGQKVFSQIAGNSSSSLFINSSVSSSVSPITFPAPTDPPHPIYLGSFGGGNRGNFKLQEFILYNTQQFANRTYIENNINSYYNTYTTTGISTENAYVNTWYDQSGNNRHATQTATGSQPIIVSSGSLITSSFARPSVKFDGVDDYLDTATITVTSQSIFSVQQNIAGKNVDVIFGSDGSNYYSNNIVSGELVVTNGGTGGSNQDTFSGGFSTTSSITSYHRDGIGTVSGSAYRNGIRLTQTNNSITAQTASYSDLGGFGGFTFQGFISEFLLYNNSKLSSRGLIEDNINGYYNLFSLPPLASGSGYVTQWYDQSGNNKHAIQTINTRQPIIVSSGSVFLENNKPAILFPRTNEQGFVAGTITSTPSDYSIYYVKNAKGGTNPWLLIFGNSSYISQTNPGSATTYYLLDSGAPQSLTGTSATPQRQHVGEIYLNSSNNSDSRAYENNTLQKQGFTTGTYSKVAIPNLQISRWDYGLYTGSAQEIIISTNNHLPNRSDIVSNINSYFNIY